MTDPTNAKARKKTGRGRTSSVRSPGATTSREVADIAGVSLMTVSNFMNNRRDLLRPETWNRVADAVDKLNYRPNIAARGLRLSSFRTIGMLVLDPSPKFLADHYTSQLIAGLSNHINQRGYVLAMQGVMVDSQDEVILLSGTRTDAICMFMSGEDEARHRLISMAANIGQPLIIFQEPAKINLPNLCSIRQDDYQGGFWIGQHLSELGVRRPVWLSSQRMWPALKERERGLRDAFSNAGIPDIDVIHTLNTDYESIRERLISYLANNAMPDAIAAANDDMGVAVLRCLRDMEIDVPQTIKVTGFNAFSALNLSDPLLTTVKSPAYELGVQAGKELLQWLETMRFSSNEIILPVTPIPATSTVGKKNRAL